MRQALGEIRVETRRRGLVEITRATAAWVADQGIAAGLLTLFCRHTSASLLIQENAAPEVRADLEAFFDRLVPEGAGRYRHDDEGPDDMPGHIRAALGQTHLAIPVSGGDLALGRWQGVYLFEHRRAPHSRAVALHLIGE